MLDKFYTEFFHEINKKEFDQYIINIANNCINYIKESTIKRLENKNDGTPLSAADLKVDNIIRKSLNLFNSNINVLSEEYKFSLNSYLKECYWIIDPIDGTRSYISGGDEYTVNIALIYKGEPYLGLIAHPPSKKIWYAKNKKLIIINNGIKQSYKASKKNLQDYLTVITSKEINSELESFLKKFKKIKRIKISSSLKFCKLAEGKADLYPRFVSISKWDIAAGHAILNASGGELIDLDGNNINYNKKSSKTGKFLALSTKETKDKFKIYS
jgi:3'(2'), 5'-bisphosphate nucleotidase